MAYNETLANRIRETLADIVAIEEKEMFGGICFMVDDKMCVGVMKEEMMCRINPDIKETVLEINGCRPMKMGKKTMQGYVLVSEDTIKSKKAFDYWINLCLEFNVIAKSSKRKK